MNKKLIFLYKFLLLSFSLMALLLPLVLIKYLEDIEYNPYHINENNEYLKIIKFENKSEENQEVSLLNDIPFEKEKNKQINVCILDSFKKDSNNKENDYYSHGENVMNMIGKRYEGNIYLLPVEHFTFGKTPISEWNKCDVINYSMGVESKNLNNTTEKYFIEFLKEYKGILIAAAGNEGETKENSQWSYIRSKYKNEINTSNLLLVTQGLIENEEKSIPTSYGYDIDLVVFNYGEKLYGKKQYGSSFATPVVTSIVANLLASGETNASILEKINNLNKITIDSYTYKNFDISEMYK